MIRELRHITYPASFGYYGDACKLEVTWIPKTQPPNWPVIQRLIGLLQWIAEHISSIILLTFVVVYDDATNQITLTIWATAPEYVAQGFSEVEAQLGTFVDVAQPAMEEGGFEPEAMAAIVTLEPFESPQPIDLGGTITWLVGILGGILILREVFKPHSGGGV